jgi:redox-sensitive bicupin YhaK (pirin superfamily)
MTAERSLDQAVYPCTVADIAEPDNVLLPGHDVPLGRYTVVRRLLPHRQRRMIGAWCFVDHFGPDDVTGRPGMQVPPHPHTGLQTVTWLVDGVIEHRDSLGSCQTIEPGQLNLMTSGLGIAHSEYTPTEHPALMHGLQLWLALPEDARHGTARFEHHERVPVQRIDGATVTVIVGQLGAARSPARVHTPVLAAEIVVAVAAQHRLPVDSDFEHGILVMSGAASIAGTDLAPGSLLYLGPGRNEIPVTVPGSARLFMLGGVPFDESLVMWWNFVGRSHEEIVAAREDWMAGRRFGAVTGCAAEPLPAPQMPTVRLKARDRRGSTA